MICIFFGHRDAQSSIKKLLEETIIDLINEGVNDFYVGNNGNYDYAVQLVLSDISKNNCKVRLTILLSRPDEKAIFAEQAYTMFPDGLENVPPRFAISKRNDLLLKRANIVVGYARNPFSNSYKMIEKAKRMGLRVINLAELSKQTP